jgi:hypothetical protein
MQEKWKRKGRSWVVEFGRRCEPAGYLPLPLLLHSTGTLNMLKCKSVVSWPPSPSICIRRRLPTLYPASALRSEEYLLLSHWVVLALVYNSNAIVFVIPTCLPRLPVDRRGVDIFNCAPFPSSMTCSLSTHGTENVRPNSIFKLEV